MIDCPNADIRDRLPDLVNESLPADVRRLVLAHLEGCTACTAELEILRVVRLVVVSGTPSVDVTNIVAALPRRNDTRLRGRSWARWQIAAAVTVLAAGAGSLAVMRQHSVSDGRDTTLFAQVVADSGAGLAMTGSLADLDEAELQDLAQKITTIEALPSTEVETISVGLSGATAAEIPDSILDDLEKM
jgi:hypothetical protein